MIASRLKLATGPGQFYYNVDGHLLFYSAVTPAQETERLEIAGFSQVAMHPCNVISFRDITRSERAAKLERAAIKLINKGDKLRL